MAEPTEIVHLSRGNGITFPAGWSVAVPEFPRVEDYAGAWAIEPSAGAALLDLARRSDLFAHVRERSAGPAPVVAAAATFGTVTANGQTVAVIPLRGTLMKSVGSMSAGTSTVAARRAIRAAAADPDVSAILLAIDSPGGTVAGTADLAADVKAASKKKPVWAHVDDLGASAAYWVASQADKVFANTDTALVGSIGTLAVMYDLSGQAEKEGIKTLVFATGPLKGAGAPGAAITDQQQEYFRALIEESQTAFDAAVQKARSLTDKQLAAVKTGGVFSAREAADRKLIDGVQSFDVTLSQLAAESRSRSRAQAQTTRADSGPVPVRSAAVNENQTPTPAASPTAAPALDADLTAYRAQRAAELQRIAGVEKVCAKHPSVAAQAITEGWSVEKAELAAMKADLPKGVGPMNPAAGPTILVRGDRPMPAGVTVNDAITAAICLQLDAKNPEKRFGAETLNAADDHFRGVTLSGVLLMAAAANGYPCRPGQRVTSGNVNEVFRAAFAPTAAGFSTMSVPGILTAVANKELAAGYQEGDETWREVAQTKSVPNFYQRTVYRLLDSLEYEEVGPGGEIKHGMADKESYTIQPKTYAKMFAMTRTDWINDDLTAFQDIRARLGRGGKKKFNNVFWTNFLAGHNTFFTTARTNYITGATTNLAADGVGLALGVKAFRQMVSPSADGSKRVGGQPDRLLVPPELESVARTLFVNNNIGAVSGATANIYSNLYRPVVVPWLSDSNFTGNSATAWYLLRNPADLAMMTVSFIDGRQEPVVEMADTDFSTLGVQFRGYHDFGCDQAEYLAGVKSKGAA